MQPKKLLRSIGICIGSVLLAIVIGCILMTCAYVMPTYRMLPHVVQSEDSINVEGSAYYWAPGYPGARLDEYTDNIMMQTAVFEGTGNKLRDAMLNPRMIFPNADLNPGDALINYVYGARNGEITTYGRYWHGYLLFLKPLLLFFNLSDIRMFNMVLQWGLALSLLILAYRKAGLRLVIPLGIAILSLNPLSTALSFQYSSIYLLTLIACILQLQFELYRKRDGWLLYLWLGIATAFFDFLTYPPAALGICLIQGLALREGRSKEKLAYTIAAGFSWGIGYGGMWGGKWLAGSLLTGQNILADAVEKVQYRIGAQTVSAEGGSTFTYGDILLKNIGVYYNAAGLLMLLGLVILVGYLILVKGYRFRPVQSNLAAFLGVALIPFAWYFVLKNHSGVHYWMTHRNLSITIMALSSFVSFSLIQNGGTENG